MNTVTEFLAAGTSAPPFSLKAEVSGRPVNLASTPGDLLLVFHSYQTAPVVGEIIRAVRGKYPNPDHILIAGAADMRPVPRLLYSTAKAYIRSAYNKASKEVPAGQDPADHIIILADWDGALFEAYRAPRTDQQVALVLVDEPKRIAGTYFGTHPAQAALSLLDNLQLSKTSRLRTHSLD